MLVLVRPGRSANFFERVERDMYYKNSRVSMIYLCLPSMRSTAQDNGRRGRATCSPSSCRTAASVRKLGCASDLRQERATRSQAATVETTDVTVSPIDEVPCYSPKALQLESGELSQVVRDPSDAPEDVFRCVGCTDAACQVLVFQAQCLMSLSRRTAL